MLEGDLSGICKLGRVLLSSIVSTQRDMTALKHIEVRFATTLRMVWLKLLVFVPLSVGDSGKFQSI